MRWLNGCEYYKRMYDIHEPSILDKFTVVNRATEDRLTNTISENQKRDEYLKVRSIYG
jgi:hypothetical protein